MLREQIYITDGGKKNQLNLIYITLEGARSRLDQS
jgi:hypothetical protein